MADQASGGTILAVIGVLTALVTLITSLGNPNFKEGLRVFVWMLFVLAILAVVGGIAWRTIANQEEASAPNPQPEPSVVVPITDPTVPPVSAIVPTAPPTQAPSVPIDPAATPTVPAVTPIVGPGSPQLLNNPLPSGPAWDAVAPALTLAQQLADALAGGDWITARRIDATLPNDQKLAAGYGNLDRSSLMLLDARPEGTVFRLLLVSVANENAGTQTRLFCLEWTSDSTTGTVQPHSGTVGQLSPQIASAMSPEAVRNDATLDPLVRAECHWS